MNIAPECVSCIVGQSERVCNAIDADDKLREKILLHVSSSSRDFNFFTNKKVIYFVIYFVLKRFYMSDFNEILNNLSFEQQETLISIYNESNECMLLVYYLISIFDKEIDTNENELFNLQETLISFINEDMSNILKIVDLFLEFGSISEKQGHIDLNHTEVMKAILNLQNGITKLHKQEEEYLTIQEISELIKMSVADLRIKLFDPSLLYPFKKRKSGTKIVLKKKEVMKWRDANF